MNDKSTQGVPAVGFLVLAFTDEKAGDEAMQMMKKGKKDKTFYYENAAVIRQDTAGKVHYQETGDMKTGKGAGVGALIGGIVGMLGGPGGAALGASAGAAIGAASAHRDAGFRDESLKTVALALKPGTSAVFAITSKSFLKEVQQKVGVEDIRRFIANLSNEISDKLNEGKSLALGIILSEAGLGIKEVTVNESSIEVIAIAITQDAALSSTAGATDEEVDYEVAGVTSEEAFVERENVPVTGAAEEEANNLQAEAGDTEEMPSETGDDAEVRPDDG